MSSDKSWTPRTSSTVKGSMVWDEKWGSKTQWEAVRAQLFPIYTVSIRISSTALAAVLATIMLKKCFMSIRRLQESLESMGELLSFYDGAFEDISTLSR